MQLHNAQLHDIYSSVNITGIIRSLGLRWGEIRSTRGTDEEFEKNSNRKSAQQKPVRPVTVARIVPKNLLFSVT
jgi:hypothetical protein